MIIPDRTYSTEACSTVNVVSNSQTHSDLHGNGTNWSGIGGGSYNSLSYRVSRGGSTGDGAKHSFQVLHNGQEVQISLGAIAYNPTRITGP